MFCPIGVASFFVLSLLARPNLQAMVAAMAGLAVATSAGLFLQVRLKMK
jgi:hypothetical protein